MKPGEEGEDEMKLNKNASTKVESKEKSSSTEIQLRYKRNII